MAWDLVDLRVGEWTHTVSCTLCITSEFYIMSGIMIKYVLHYSYVHYSMQRTPNLLRCSYDSLCAQRTVVLMAIPY